MNEQGAVLLRTERVVVRRFTADDIDTIDDVARWQARLATQRKDT